jgi:tRNA threonylcarbamoyladenosine biosynthesis protein TsaB
MRILGIDTATPTASIAVVENGEAIAERIYDNAFGEASGSARHAKGNHAEIVLPAIESVLGAARCSWSDLSGIAVSIGPGSFTGLRIGLATVKGLAYEWGMPVVGISTLCATAARARSFEGVIGALLDARKNEVYVALFRSQRCELTRLTQDIVTSVHSAADLIRKYVGTGVPVLATGDGAKVHEKLLLNRLGDSLERFGTEDSLSVAARVAQLAGGQFGAHSAVDLGTLEPLYLRPCEAEARIKKSDLTC